MVPTYLAKFIQCRYEFGSVCVTVADVEIICTKHAYVQDPPDLTLFNFMKDTESIPLVNLLRKN